MTVSRVMFSLINSLSVNAPTRETIQSAQLCSLLPVPQCLNRNRVRDTAFPLRSAIYNQTMANLTLVYGMRLLPADEIVRVGDAPIELKNGNEARVTMHVLEGSREEIEKQLKMSLDAFFDFYPEI